MNWGVGKCECIPSQSLTRYESVNSSFVSEQWGVDYWFVDTAPLWLCRQIS